MIVATIFVAIICNYLDRQLLFDPQTRNPDPFRHRRPPVRVDRQRIPDLLRHHVSHIGHSGGPLRFEEGDAGRYCRMVAGLHRRRPFDQRRRIHHSAAASSDWPSRRSSPDRSWPSRSGSRNATAPRPTVSVRRAVRWERSSRRWSSRGWPGSCHGTTSSSWPVW